MAVYIDGYEIDVFVREEPAFSNEITEHQVESGSDIADHVRAKPTTLTVEGIVSDTPIGDLADRRASSVPPSQEAYERLQDINKARQPVTVVTSLSTYTDMVIETLTPPRDRRTGKALRFTCVFKQVRVAEVDKAARIDLPIAKSKVNRGNKPAVTIGEAQIEGPPEKRKSLLKRAVNAIGDL